MMMWLIGSKKRIAYCACLLAFRRSRGPGRQVSRIAYRVLRVAYCVVGKAGSNKLNAIRCTLNAERGFTLIEVMVAVAVLSFGLVMVYQAFFMVFNSFNYSVDYLEAVFWLDQRIWESQDSIRRVGALENNQEQGEFIARNKKFSWLLSSRVLDPAANLSAVNLEVTWKEGGKDVSVSRVGYARYE